MMGPGMPPPLPPKAPAMPKPRRLREVPSYLARLIGGFCSRLFYILSLVREARPSTLIWLLLLCLLDGILPVAGAVISAELLDRLGVAYLAAQNGAAADLSPVLWLLVLFFGYQFCNRVLGRINTMVTRIAGEVVTNHIRVKIMRKARTVDPASFDDPEFYEKLENANREAGMRPVTILTATFNVISALISVVSFVAILATLHWVAPLLIFLMAIPGAVVNYIYRRRSFQYMRHRSKDRRQMDYYSNLMVDKDMVKELRLLDLSDTLLDKYDNVFQRYYHGLRRLILHEGFWHIGISLLTVVAQAALFAYVAVGVVHGQYDLGDYSLYTGALNSIMSCVNTLVSTTATIYEGTLFIDNMMTFMQAPVKLLPSCIPPRMPKAGAAHTLEFRDVSFAYPGGGAPVLQHVDLTLRSGESTVLVGLNGAGKTTLIKLLTRLYDPTEGAIYLDGHDLREYDVRALYDLFGIIFQDFGKYAVSVRENITFGDVHRPVSEEAVQAAAQDGAADDFIRRLPDGYDTPLTRYFEENGIELSIGQWQKLSISRAFYKVSDILILDEPTAALDPLAEQEVYQQFARLGKDKITVFVSHRLSSATTADQVVVLEHGQIIEKGTHAALMAQQGRYHTLFTTQAQRYTEQPQDGAKGAPADV